MLKLVKRKIGLCETIDSHMQSKSNDEACNAPCQKVISIASPHGRHSLDDLRDLMWCERRPTDEHCLPKLSVWSVPWSDLEDASMFIGVSAVAVLGAIDVHAGMIKAHAEPIQVPVDRGHGVGVLWVEEVVHVELDRHAQRRRASLVQDHREGKGR